MSKQKIPKRNKYPSHKKQVRNPIESFDFKNEKPAWQINSIDLGGEWGWNKVLKRDILKEIYPKLKSFETMTWHEIEGRKHHSVPISNICHEAQQRLNEIENSDIEDLFSFRLTGEKRLWGILDRNILKILWWDPEHTVCPSFLKHT